MLFLDLASRVRKRMREAGLLRASQQQQREINQEPASPHGRDFELAMPKSQTACALNLRLLSDSAPVSTSAIFRTLALVYFGLILLECLFPFSGWRDPSSPLFSFLFERRYSRFDLIANIAAYAPFGFLLAMCFFARLSAAGAVIAAILCGAFVSFAIEIAQVFVSGRVSSRIDLLANVGGCTIGALAAVVVSRTTLFARLRATWFAPGGWADGGIALLALFVISAAKPAVPLIGNLAPNAGTFSIVINTMLNCLALGLFVAVIAKTRERVVPILSMLVVAITSLKLLAAWLLLRNSALGINVEAMMGIGYGFTILALILWRRDDVVPYCVAALVCAFAFTQLHAFTFPYDRTNDEYRYQEVVRLIAEWWPAIALVHLLVRPKAII
ncbi:MAG TPA: VanZ family protein [Burkholderiales bacterium]|nr:VanZ family protein [Burkholderiales bacterium]